MALELPFGVKVLNPIPVEDKYLNNGIPYSSTTEVNNTISESIRYSGLTVNVAGTEYWYRTGVTNTDLEVKSNGSSYTFGEGLTESGGVVDFGTSTVTTSITNRRYLMGGTGNWVTIGNIDEGFLEPNLEIGMFQPAADGNYITLAFTGSHTGFTPWALIATEMRNFSVDDMDTDMVFATQIKGTSGNPAEKLRLTSVGNLLQTGTTDIYHEIKSSTGDSFINFVVTGGSSYSLGIDNSDGDKLKITGNITSPTPSSGDTIVEIVSQGIVIGGESPNNTNRNAILELNGGTGSTNNAIIEINSFGSSAGDPYIHWNVGAGIDHFYMGIEPTVLTIKRASTKSISFGDATNIVSFSDASVTNFYHNNIINIGSITNMSGNLQFSASTGTIILPTSPTTTTTGALRYSGSSLQVYDSGWNSVGGSGTNLNYSISIPAPTNSEDITIAFTNRAITITEMRAVLIGSSTPSVTWTIRHNATDRSVSGTEVVTGGTVTTGTTSGSDVTTFNNASISADSFIWVETTAVSGTVDEIHISIIYDET